MRAIVWQYGNLRSFQVDSVDDAIAGNDNGNYSLVAVYDNDKLVHGENLTVVRERYKNELDYWEKLAIEKGDGWERKPPQWHERDVNIRQWRDALRQLEEVMLQLKLL